MKHKIRSAKLIDRADQWPNLSYAESDVKFHDLLTKMILKGCLRDCRTCLAGVAVSAVILCETSLTVHRKQCMRELLLARCFAYRTKCRFFRT